MKPWLVAHRGAPNEAQENTLDAFKAARKYAVGYIEFDVRITKDNVAVIHHDPSIDGALIAESTYDDLLALDPQLAKFEDVVNEHSELPLFVELKSNGSAAHAEEYLRHNDASFATSFIEEELRMLQDSGIDSKRMFLAQHNHPIGLLSRATQNKFGGITLNKWYLNPLLYWRAKRADLTIMIYTVNSSLWARIVRLFYKEVLICTDYPDKLERLA
ncbi:MAG: glycerophosphodiester phosphodiesterase [Candidatus Saccharimonadales bacterium]